MLPYFSLLYFLTYLHIHSLDCLLGACENHGTKLNVMEPLSALIDPQTSTCRSFREPPWNRHMDSSLNQGPFLGPI